MMSSGRTVWRSHSLPVLSSFLALSVVWAAPAVAQSAPPDAPPAPAENAPPSTDAPPVEATPPADASPASPPAPEPAPAPPVAPTPAPAPTAAGTAATEAATGPQSIEELSAMSLEDLLNVEV